MADWAELHHDMLVLIARKIKLVEDFVCFCSVCRSWREAGASQKQYLPPQIPWLMLPNKLEHDHHLHIFSICKETILTKNLYILEMYDKKFIGLNYGWVLTVSYKGDMHLVHPLSRSQIELPRHTSVSHYEPRRTWPSYAFATSAALSVNPSESSDFVLMIVHGEMGYYLSYWRQGDERWSGIPNPEICRPWFSDVIYYQDQFYAIEGNGKAWGLKVSGPRDININNPVLTLLARIDSDLVMYRKSYIVESGGALLVVAKDERRYERRPHPLTIGFRVYELDLINGGYKPINRLGDHRAIFVGHNTSISLDASEVSGIKSNHIYFTDDYDESYEGGWKNMGSYNLGDARITRIKVDNSLGRSRASQPFWFIPSL